MLRRMSHEAHVHVSPRRVLAAAAVTVLAAGVELWLSQRAGSLFLVADAVHLIAHMGIFGVLLIPVRGRRHAAREDIVTCVVLALVVGIAIWIAVQAIRNVAVWKEPPKPGYMLFSLLGLAANLTSAWLFRDPAQHRWSFRAALAHELSDASLTVAGLVGAGAIALFGFRWVDPALSLAIAAWLGTWATRLLVRRIRVGQAAWDLE
jgi:cobalt-zinc-cadmium efflux system protein